MDTEPTQFTLEGTEVVHIANMDVTAAADQAHPSDVPQVEVLHDVEPHHHQHEHMVIDVNEADASEMSHIILVKDDVTPDSGEQQQVIIHHEEPENEHPTWHSYFFQLQGHKSTFGTLDVDPQTNPSLYAWVEEQRKLHKLWKENGDKGAITQERIILLDALGFDYEGNAEPDYGVQAEAAAAAAASNLSGSSHDVETFHLRLAQLEQYKTVNGHPNVPETYKENPLLGRWVSQQRAMFRKQTLTQDRIDSLTAIGFDFTPGDKKIMFDTRLEQLKEYKDKHGDANVPRRFNDIPGLGEWLHHQKKLYRRWENDQKGGMNESRRTLLLEAGVDFSDDSEKNTPHSSTNEVVISLKENDEDDNVTRSLKWDEKFNELREYRATNGHTNVPRRSKRNPANDPLGEWVHFQRRQYRNMLNGKNSTLTIARKKALELLDFQWYRNGGSSMNHHQPLSQDSIKFMSVRDAVQAQILNAHEEGKLAPWEDRFSQLTEYVQRFGNADVPINYAENLSLGSWVYRQRIAFKFWNQEDDQKEVSEGASNVEQEAKGLSEEDKPYIPEVDKMTQERYDKLVAVGFDFEIKKIPDDFKTEDGRDPATLILSKTADEEEKPMLEDEQDVIEITFEEEIYEETSKTELNSDIAAQHIPSEIGEATVKQGEVTEEAGNQTSFHADDSSTPVEEMAGKIETTTAIPQLEVPTTPHDVEYTGEGVEPSKKRRRVTTVVKVEWEERILELIQYKIRKGNCNVPVKWKPNCGLAEWVWRQRDQYRLYRMGQPSTLTTTRIAKLTELGFEFIAYDHHGNPVFHDESEQCTKSGSDAKERKSRQMPPREPSQKPIATKSRFKDGKWLESLAKVVAYKEENGTCNVPRKWKRDPTLGEWVHFQRRQYRLKQLGRRHHMTEARIQKLEAIGFEWSRGTPNPPNYRMYSDEKDIYDESTKLEEGGSMMEMNSVHIMDYKEQAQQIVDVVEHHHETVEHHIQMEQGHPDQLPLLPGGNSVTHDHEGSGHQDEEMMLSI